MKEAMETAAHKVTIEYPAFRRTQSYLTLASPRNSSQTALMRFGKFHKISSVLIDGIAVEMLRFCPSCQNALTITKGTGSGSNRAIGDFIPHRFECRTCSYWDELNRTEDNRKPMTPKKPEDVLGGAEAWEHVEKTEVDELAVKTAPLFGLLMSMKNASHKDIALTPVLAKCPNSNCTSNEAYFRQMQVRSADEPMTQYFRCVSCARQWQEG